MPQHDVQPAQKSPAVLLRAPFFHISHASILEASKGGKKVRGIFPKKSSLIRGIPLDPKP